MLQTVGMTVEDLVGDDGLVLPEVGEWAADKHSVLGYYAALFSSSMKNKWDCRVYIDLFAGAGKARIKDTKKVVPGSPFVALGLEVPFDRYIFGEQDAELTSALQTRVNTHFKSLNATVLNVDANTQIGEVLRHVPKFDRQFKGLAFCFVDPFNAQNLKFRTLETIAGSLFVDFLVLIPSFMEIHRNEMLYTRSDCTILDEFLGTREWRIEWSAGKSHFREFGVFVADQFGKAMKKLGFLYDSPEDYETVRKGQNCGLNLYHLAFFSRNPLGAKFWREARQRTATQLSLI